MKAQQIFQIFRFFCSVWFFFMCFYETAFMLIWLALSSSHLNSKQASSSWSSSWSSTHSSRFSLSYRLFKGSWLVHRIHWNFNTRLGGFGKMDEREFKFRSECSSCSCAKSSGRSTLWVLFLPLSLLSRLQVRWCLCGPFNLLHNPVKKKSPINKKWCHTFWWLSLHLKTSTLRPHGIGVCLQFSPPGCNRYRNLNEEHYS